MKICNTSTLTRALALTLVALINTPALANDLDHRSDRHLDRDLDRHRGFREVSLLWFIGGTQPYIECEVPETELGSTQASCHEHELLDLKRDRVIGTALDATNDVFATGDDALYATGTTTFEVSAGRFAGSTLQVRGIGTIQPTVVGSPHFEWKSRAMVSEQTPISHIAGIFPNPGENMVLKGTGVFKGATGTFALFGGLDLASDPTAGTFNCIYKIDLKIPRRYMRMMRDENQWPF